MDTLTIFGAVSVPAMLIFYALEPRSPAFVLAFAGACLASSIYGFGRGHGLSALWSSSGQRWRCDGGGNVSFQPRGLRSIVVGILVYTGSLAQINRYFGFGPGGLGGSL